MFLNHGLFPLVELFQYGCKIYSWLLFYCQPIQSLCILCRQALKRRYDGSIQPDPNVPSLNEAVRLEVPQQPQPGGSSTNLRPGVNWT
jgi:hypothetical protein